MIRGAQKNPEPITSKGAYFLMQVVPALKNFLKHNQDYYLSKEDKDEDEVLNKLGSRRITYKQVFRSLNLVG
jgi:hypothetical protein